MMSTVDVVFDFNSDIAYVAVFIPFDVKCLLFYN